MTEDTVCSSLPSRSSSDDSNDNNSDDNTSDSSAAEEWEWDDVLDMENDAGNSNDASHNNNADFYIRNMHRPVCPGSPLTVLQLCFLRLLEKQQCKVSDTYFDRECRSVKAMLPEGNLYPPSLYMMQRIIGCPDVADFEKHVCINDCHIFEDCARGRWEEIKDQCCPECAAPRFRTKETRNGYVLIPQKRYWDFGLEGVIRNRCFADHEWCKLRGTCRNEFTGDFYSSAEAQRIDRCTGGALSNPDNSAYELGFDFGQMFGSKVHSSGVLGLR